MRLSRRRSSIFIFSFSIFHFSRRLSPIFLFLSFILPYKIWMTRRTIRMTRVEQLVMLIEQQRLAVCCFDGSDGWQQVRKIFNKIFRKSVRIGHLKVKFWQILAWLRNVSNSRSEASRATQNLRKSHQIGSRWAGSETATQKQPRVSRVLVIFSKSPPEASDRLFQARVLKIGFTSAVYEKFFRFWPPLLLFQYFYARKTKNHFWRPMAGGCTP